MKTEEKRYTRKDLKPTEAAEPQKQFEDRINTFVFELEEILAQLRALNTQGRNITNLKSPFLTNYLLWRVLNEMKLLNNNFKNNEIK